MQSIYPIQLPQINADAADSSDCELVPSSDLRSTVISINFARMSGTPCFVNTRVPIKYLWDYLESGGSIEDFLEGFEGITREECVQVLSLAFARLMEGLPQP